MIEETRFTGSWSYSKWTSFEACPYAFKRSYIDKVPIVETPAMARGKEKHLKAELYLRGELPRIPELPPIKLLDAMRSVGALPEERWAFDRGWNAVDWEAPEAWLKMVIDVLIPGERVRIYDWKTGKRYPNHIDQLELYALGASKRFGGRTFRCIDYYIDTGGALRENITIDTAIEDKWIKRAESIYNERAFDPKKHKYCFNCAFREECPLILNIWRSK